MTSLRITKQPFATLKPIWMPDFNFRVLGAGNQNLFNVTPLLLPSRFLHINTRPLLTSTSSSLLTLLPTFSQLLVSLSLANLSEKYGNKVYFVLCQNTQSSPSNAKCSYLTASRAVSRVSF